MKRTLTTVGLFLIIAGAGITLALGADAKLIRVNVPFAFQVGKESFPPGQYQIQLDRVGPGSSLGSRLILRSTDGKTARLLTTVPEAVPLARSQAAGLTFRKYDQTYFLAKVNTSYTGCKLIESPAEKELSARMKVEHEHVPAQAE